MFSHTLSLSTPPTSRERVESKIRLVDVGDLRERPSLQPQRGVDGSVGRRRAAPWFDKSLRTETVSPPFLLSFSLLYTICRLTSTAARVTPIPKLPPFVGLVLSASHASRTNTRHILLRLAANSVLVLTVRALAGHQFESLVSLLFECCLSTCSYFPGTKI